MDEQKEKQNAKKKRSALPIYAIGIVWLLYAGKLNTFRGILSCAVVSAIVYAILRIVLPGKKTDEPPKAAAPEQPQPKQAEKKPEPQPEPEPEEKLPPELRHTAKLRLENDTATLTELAALEDPPVSKSQISKRLQKIHAYYEESCKQNRKGGS